MGRVHATGLYGVINTAAPGGYGDREAAVKGILGIGFVAQQANKAAHKQDNSIHQFVLLHKCNELFHKASLTGFWQAGSIIC
jgi:hypothetical protein